MKFLNGQIAANWKDRGTGGKEIYFYHYDLRGSVTSILDPDGVYTSGYQYDAFGNTARKGDSDFKNEMEFTGSISDTSSGLQYMNARYYNPATGRFLTQDAAGGDAWTNNLYVYCGNNPVSFSDPTGYKWVGNYLFSWWEDDPEQVVTAPSDDDVYTPCFDGDKTDVEEPYPDVVPRLPNDYDTLYTINFLGYMTTASPVNFRDVISGSLINGTRVGKVNYINSGTLSFDQKNGELFGETKKTVDDVGSTLKFLWDLADIIASGGEFNTSSDITNDIFYDSALEGFDISNEIAGVFAKKISGYTKDGLEISEITRFKSSVSIYSKKLDGSYFSYFYDITFEYDLKNNNWLYAAVNGTVYYDNYG